MNLSNILIFLKKINYILVAAWVIPAAVLLTILYLNFLPFGYQKTLTINVGSKNDDKGEFRLEQSQFLGARQELDGQTFRYLDGLAYAVYEPKVVLRNATIEAELTASSGVSFILPPDLSDVKWDYDWNAKNIGDYFESEVSEKQIFEAFIATPATAITTANPLLRGVSCTQDGVCEACKPNELCYKDSFALELTWSANRNAQLLTGDINLYQNAKELILKYQGLTLKYPLPDYFLGENRTAIIGFDGKKLYLVTDKNDKSTKVISIATCKSPLNNGWSRELGNGVCEAGPIVISKTSTITSWRLHLGQPQFIKTKSDSIYLDGSTRLTMPNTADKFEDGPFSVYAEWTPEKAANGQQIIGHYNWEIYQNEKTVSFQVGRMSTSTGQIYKIFYNVEETFFNKQHSLIAIYSPISTGNPSCFYHSEQGEESTICEVSTSTETNPVINGYIELFIDGVFAGREHFADETIWQNYGNQNLSLGWTPHNYSSYPNLQGKIKEIKISQDIFSTKEKSKQTIITSGKTVSIPLYGTGDLNSVQIKIEK